MTLTGSVHAINVSDGGVPKLNVDEVAVSETGLAGDRQRDLVHHGGHDRAVCLFGLELIELLRAEGHPIEPGSTGENLTLTGVDWAKLNSGCKLLFEGGVALQVTGPAPPCRHIAQSFLHGEFERLHPGLHPGQARLYTRVLKTGQLSVGESFRIDRSDHSRTSS